LEEDSFAQRDFSQRRLQRQQPVHHQDEGAWE
jgi:hypothetical protein